MLNNELTTRTLKPARLRTRGAAVRIGMVLLSFLLLGAAKAAELPVELVNHATGEGISGVRINAVELLADGTYEWRQARETDVEGIARFDLDGLGEGRRYVLRAQPFAHWLETDPITEPAWFGWHVGKLAIQVVNGQTGAPMPGEPVWLREDAGDGTYPYVQNATTDAQGWVRLDPPQLGQTPLVLRAMSPTDGELKYSAPIHGPGTRRLELGNAPLVAAVLDGVTREGLPNQVVEAYERTGTGGLALRATRRTGADGRAAFDLDGLGQGRTYVLRAEPHTHRIESEDIGIAGEHELLAGTMQVALANGASGQPYRRQPVTLFEVLEDGSRQFVSHLESDGNGDLFLEPAGLGERRYQLRASSPVDGRHKFSEIYAGGGRYIFSVGGPALTVKVIDHTSDTGLIGVRVAALELLPDGTEQWTAAFDTDAEGMARFDLDGLGEGRRYVLRAQPYAHWLTSEPITDTGWFGWRVGRVAVRLVHGETNAPIAGEPVWLRERAGDGTFPHVLAGTTDAEGWVHLDPPQLGEVPLVLRARSPSDGEFKYTAPIWSGGTRTLALGNTPLVAAVVDGVSGIGLPEVTVEAFERTETGGLALRATRRTGADGRAAFDLDGLGHGRAYVLRAAPFGHRLDSDDIGIAGEHVLRAGALQVALVSGESGNPYPRQSVVMLEVRADGSRQFVRTLESDGEGMLYLDPEELGERRYQLRAESPVDGRPKFSEVYAEPGAHTFTVGGPALTVKLIDHLSSAGMPGVRIVVHEVLAGGSKNWAAAFETDADGRARFDLDGLGNGRRYVLRAKPYAHWVESDPVSETGWLGWRVGHLAVQVVDGQSGAPVPGEPVYLREKASDGSFPYVMNATTDENGWVHLDPPQLGSVPLILRARSPTDGQLKETAPINGAGSRTLRLGNAPLIAAVLDGVANVGLPGVLVEAYERTGTGGLALRGARRTGTNGRVAFDLDGLGIDRAYVLRAAPFGQRIESTDITSAGEHPLRAGTLQVALTNGANGNPYRHKTVALLELLADGTRQFVRSVESDGQGMVYFEPASLGDRRYQLRAASLVDGRAKFSDVFDAAGRYTFAVGGEALTVKLIDHQSYAGIPGVQIIAKEVLPDGSQEWAAAFETDADGKVRFDLDGLGAGRRYVLHAQPFAHWLESDQVVETGWFGWRVNRLPVTVTDAAGEALADATVTVYEKSATGALRQVIAATTNQAGDVHFDPDELGGEATYVIRVADPLGTGEDFYSDLVRHGGPVRIAAIAGQTNAPDLTPPQVSIDSSLAGARLGDHGFELFGSFAENDRLRSISVRLVGANGLIADLAASVRHGAGSWSATVPALTTATPAPLAVNVQALDAAGNIGEAATTINLVHDAAGPEITVSSHRDQDTVPDGAFLVRGSVYEDIGEPTLVARLRNEAGEIVDERDVEVIQPSGTWTFTAFASEALPSASITLELVATDAAGNESIEPLQLYPTPEARRNRRALARLTFGPTPELEEEIARIGLAAFIEQQLAPETIDDSAFLAARTLPSDPAERTLEAALHSRRQLREVMTVFWDNHFNTNLGHHGNDSYENAEHEAFREHALGRFRDLLGASARSPAMLRYLDGHVNFARDPNENYARELLELHTLGDPSLVNEADVAEVARAFTGWRVQDDQFAFHPEYHDFDSKQVLGRLLPAGQGIEDGEQVLDVVAKDPATAANICFKLATLFISEVPPIRPLVACVDDFRAYANDSHQIARVLSGLFASAEFHHALLESPLSRTPLEYVLGTFRALGVGPSLRKAEIEARRMGMPLHRNPVPTGYSDSGSSWVNSGALYRRLRFLQAAILGWDDYEGAIPELAHDLLMSGVDGVDAVSGHLLSLAHGAAFGRAEWQLVSAVLTDDGARRFDYRHADIEVRLRRALLVAFALPAFHLQ